MTRSRQKTGDTVTLGDLLGKAGVEKMHRVAHVAPPAVQDERLDTGVIIDHAARTDETLRRTARVHRGELDLKDARIRELEADVKRLDEELRLAHERLEELSDKKGGMLVTAFRSLITGPLADLLGEHNRLCARGRYVTSGLRSSAAAFETARRELEERIEEALPMARQGIDEDGLTNFLRIVGRMRSLYERMAAIREEYAELREQRLAFESELQAIAPKRATLVKQVDIVERAMRMAGADIWKISGESREAYDLLCSLAKEIEAFGTTEELSGGLPSYALAQYQKILAFAGCTSKPRRETPRAEAQSGADAKPDPSPATLAILPGALFTDSPRPTEQTQRLVLLAVDTLGSGMTRDRLQAILLETALLSKYIDLNQYVPSALGTLRTGGYLEEERTIGGGLGGQACTYALTVRGRAHLADICRLLGEREPAVRQKLTQARAATTASRRRN